MPGLFWVIFFGLIVLALILSQWERPHHQPDEKHEVYAQACKFIDDQYPGIVKISPFENSKIEQVEWYWLVTARVDGKNMFGGPVRMAVTVKLSRTSSGWFMDAIDQR